MTQEQIQKRDKLAAMYSYAQEYLEGRIHVTKAVEELNNQYKRELEDIKALFEELFFKIYKGEI